MNEQVMSAVTVPLEILKSVICSSCKTSFFEKGGLMQQNKNCPLLLSCGHSVCESCYQNMTSNAILCGICGSSTDLSRMNGLALPRNAYLMGRFCLRNKYFALKNKTDKVSVTKNQIDQKSHQQIYNNEYLKLDATCLQCDCNFCDNSWTEVYSPGKNLQKDVPQIYNSFFFNNLGSCNIHGKNIYCNNCIGIDCLVTNHEDKNHLYVSPPRRKLELFSEVYELEKDVNLNKQKMLETIKEVKALKEKVPCRSSSYEDMQCKVVENFVRLHGIVQILEEAILKRLQIEEDEKRGQLDEILLRLEQQIEAIETFTRKIEKFTDPEQLHRDGLHQRILDTLITLRNLPSTLVTTKDAEKDGPKENPAISFDETVLESLKKFCVLNLPLGETFSLENIPLEGVVDPPKTNENSEDALEENDGPAVTKDAYRCCSDSKKVFVSDKINNSSDGYHCLPPVLPKPLNIVREKVYSVVMSYVKDPGEFYVVRSCLENQRKIINAMASNFGQRMQHPPKRVRKGIDYLVQDGTDEMWYRGRVVDLIPDDKNEYKIAVIHFLDSGKRSEVPFDRLREMPWTLQHEPPLALKCRLFDCLPLNGVWSKLSAEIMADVLDNSVLAMYVKKVEEDGLEVDLGRRSSYEHFDHELISLRDMMDFLGHASLTTGNDIMKKRSLNLNYLPRAEPGSDTFRGIITHIESESLFYIQKIGPETDYFMTLMKKLNRMYNAESEKGLICNPNLGMPCAAIYPQDGEWYRGEIINVLRPGQITVHYVDYGNKEVVHWKSVRKLKPDFLKLVPQAVPCRLREISSGEDMNAKEYLEKYFSGIIRVSVVGKEDNKLIVSLHKNEERHVKQVMMKAEKGAAPEMSDSSPAITVVDETCGNDIISKSETEHRKMSTDEESSEKSYDFSKTEVKIIQALSPSVIYLSFLHSSDQAKELENEMQEFYGSSKARSCDKWNVGDVCAAFSGKREKWYRGKVTDILDNGMIRVRHFLEVMELEDMPASDVRVLEDRYLSFPEDAIRCHLSGIFPPETEWPGLTCEFLQAQLKLHDHFYITKMGVMKNDSLPIRLWAKKKVLGGALEPSTLKWISINDVIVEHGLAVPEKDKLVKHITSGENVMRFLLKDTGDSLMPSPPCDWLPCTLFRNDSFVGVPTFIDSEGVIFIHDKEDEVILDRISSSFVDCCNKPHEQDQDWSEGQLCIVKYYLDGGWYRGKVLKVNDDHTYEVMFIDYGNVEKCGAGEIRKCIKHLNVPILAKKCVLHGISPVSRDGRWSDITIAFIYSSIVEKCCNVTIVEKTADSSEPYKVKIKLMESVIDMSEELVSLGLAKYISNSEPKELVPKDSPKQSDAVDQVSLKSCYSLLQLPHDLKIFPIQVLVVKSSEIVAHILDHESVPKEIRTAIADFVSLTNEIQRSAASQECVKNFSNGIPCINLYNGAWYRTEILRHDVNRDLILVRYVDYGNEEFVPKDGIRECSKKWCEVRTMAINFKLHNVQKRKGVKISQYVEHLTKCFSQSELTAEIMERKNETYVVEVKHKGVLAYQNMIDGGLMEFIHK